MNKCDTPGCDNAVVAITEKNGKQCKICFLANMMRSKYGVTD